MKNFTWWNPTIVLFGRGAVIQLTDQLEAAGIKSVLMLYGGKAIFKNGVYTQVAEALSRQYGRTVDKRDIKMDDVIKQPGSFPFALKLHAGVHADMTLSVTTQKD